MKKIRKKLTSLLCGLLLVACTVVSSAGTVFTLAESAAKLSLGENSISAGEAKYTFSPDRTGFYQFECSYMLVANVKDPNGNTLQGQQNLKSLAGLSLKTGVTYTVETSTSSDEATLHIREVVSKLKVGKNSPDRNGLYLFTPEKEGYYSVVGKDFEMFSYVYDDFEGEWYENPVSSTDPCYLSKQDYYIWVKKAPAELTISTADAQNLKEGSNKIADGWYSFVPKTSAFYTVSNARKVEGNGAAWLFYNELPKYGFAGAEGYYLQAGKTYKFYFADSSECSIQRVTNLMRSKEGLDYFVYNNQAMVLGYNGSDTLVWPEKIDSYSVNLANNDFHSLFKNTSSLAITFPAGMIGHRFNISYEWDKWTSDNASVVTVKHVDGDSKGNKGELILKNGGTANVVLVAGDAEDPSREYRFKITVNSAKKTAAANESKKDNEPTSSETGSADASKTGQVTATATGATGANTSDVAKSNAAAGEESQSGMSTTAKVLIGIGGGLVLLLAIASGIVIYKKKHKKTT